MEERLRELFDYQRFEQNDKLRSLIGDTVSRYAGKFSEKHEGFSVVGEDRRKGFHVIKDGSRELSDEDLTFVNAAGEMVARKDPEDLTDE